MIRKLEAEDIDTVCGIVNENWKRVYKDYVNPLLLNADGCEKRTCRLKKDFASGRLSEYVWEEQNRITAMLSVGDTADADKAGAFEVWRIYVDPAYQGKAIGGQMLNFAERAASAQSYSEIVIWAFKNNFHAVSFYQKHGYCIEKEEYLGEPYQAFGVRLTKKI